jgi:hypothetical protein
MKEGGRAAKSPILRSASSVFRDGSQNERRLGSLPVLDLLLSFGFLFAFTPDEHEVQECDHDHDAQTAEAQNVGPRLVQESTQALRSPGAAGLGANHEAVSHPSKRREVADDRDYPITGLRVRYRDLLGVLGFEEGGGAIQRDFSQERTYRVMRIVNGEAIEWLKRSSVFTDRARSA